MSTSSQLAQWLFQPWRGERDTVAVCIEQSSLSWIWNLSASFAMTSFLLSSRNVWKRLTISRWRNEGVGRCALSVKLYQKNGYRCYLITDWQHVWHAAMVMTWRLLSWHCVSVVLPVCCLVLMLCCSLLIRKCLERQWYCAWMYSSSICFCYVTCEWVAVHCRCIDIILWHELVIQRLTRIWVLHCTEKLASMSDCA